jgi:methyl-accepting chemotaxis protein
MQEALRKKLVLLVFLPALIASALLAGALCLSLASAPFSLWVAANGMMTTLAVAAILVTVVSLVCTAVAIIQVSRIVARGTKALLKTTETGRVAERDVPASLRDDVEFNVLARRIEQLSRGGKEAPEASRKIAQMEDELRKIARALEEVSVGSPYVPLPEKEGATGAVVSLLNKLLPESAQPRGAAAESVKGVEAELRETSQASQELAATAERTFLESTEALVAAREANKLAAEAEQRIQTMAAEAEPKLGLRNQKEAVREAVTRLIEAVAHGIEDLTKGLMKASSLARSSERIANRASVLALNISVESAKASLPGMNVLADEITKLADFARACSDESESVLREIETKVDSVIRGMHVAQEEVRHKTRLLGLGAPVEESPGRETKAELEKTAKRLCDSVVKLLTRVQELSKLTEKASSDADRMSRKAAAAYDQARLLAGGEPPKNPSAPSEFPEIPTLSDEDLLIEDPSAGDTEGE